MATLQPNGWERVHGMRVETNRVVQTLWAPLMYHTVLLCAQV